MRRKLVAGNWKMHGNLAQNKALLDGLLAGGRVWVRWIARCVCRFRT